MRNFRLVVIILCVVNGLDASFSQAEAGAPRFDREGQNAHPMSSYGDELRGSPIQTGWAVGLRGGAALPTDELGKNIGPLINAQLFYAISGPPEAIGGDWNLGLMVEWEQHHNVDSTQLDVETLSVMPYLEIHTRYASWSPYVTLGAGINFNAVSDEPPGTDLDAKNTFAFRGGIGTDVFLTDHLALNAEAAWKLNEGDVALKAGPVNVTGDLDASALELLLGFRWYFE